MCDKFMMVNIAQNNTHAYYTVRLLSFRTGIIKSICMKEMTVLLFSFRHTSLLTVHRFARSYSSWMPVQKSSFAMVFNILVMAFWMPEIESKRRPFKWDSTFGNKK